MKIEEYLIPEKRGDGYKLILKNLSEVELGPRNHYEGLTFEGVDLSGLSLTQCRFDRCVFTRCHISMTEFSLTQFSEVSFQACFIQGSIFLWTAALSVTAPLMSPQKCVTTSLNACLSHDCEQD